MEIGASTPHCIAKSASLISIFHSCDRVISSHRLGLGLEGDYSTKTPTHGTKFHRMVGSAELFVQNNTFAKVRAKMCRCIKSFFNFIKYHDNDFIFQTFLA